MPHTDVVTALAELGHLAGQQTAVVAPMYLMAGTAVFRYRRVLKGKRASLFRMALVAEVRNGIGIEHMVAETAVRRMAVRAFDLSLGNRVAGFTVQLTPHLFVAGDTHGGLAGFQVEAAVGVNRMAIAAGYVVHLVNPGIPGGN